jgi:hypothetical protein
VRGDSIRDLYAKTAALAGLAVLAGIGALVDYWPVGVTPPTVVAVNLPVADAARAVVPAVERVPVALVAATRPVPRPFVTALAAHGEAPAFHGLGATIALAALPEPAPTAPVPAAPAVLTDHTAPVADPVPFATGPDFDPSLVYQVAADDDAGFLSDAVDMMKTTGSTIARGGAKTGASIVSAFRAVSGAFKKLKPF